MPPPLADFLSPRLAIFKFPRLNKLLTPPKLEKLDVAQEVGEKGEFEPRR